MDNHIRTAKIEVCFLSADEGGRLNPLTDGGVGYPPHLRVKDGEMLGVTFLGGTGKPIMPSVRTVVIVRLTYWPQVSYVALKEGEKFDILEGSRVVGDGVVVSLGPIL